MNFKGNQPNWNSCWKTMHPFGIAQAFATICLKLRCHQGTYFPVHRYKTLLPAIIFLSFCQIMIYSHLSFFAKFFSTFTILCIDLCWCSHLYLCLKNLSSKLGYFKGCVKGHLRMNAITKFFDYYVAVVVVVLM